VQRYEVPTGRKSWCFNPHPSRRTGATRLRSCSLSGRVSCFNPHPSRRTGATGGGHQRAAGQRWFQSSPVPKDGCNAQAEQAQEQAQVVSILTRPEGRVQRHQRYQIRQPDAFQSSPVPKDGCNCTGVGIRQPS